MARILIIDDEIDLRTLLVRALKAAGHTVTQAGTGREAIPMLRADPPDLVLTDLVMPDQDGLEVIMMIRKELPAIRVIAMSGGSPRASLYLGLARKLGARVMLAKPFTQEQLFSALDEALSTR